ncbi:MAG: hypothetical protein AB2L21_07495 [Anaerolineaceae bacterium]
MDNNTENKPKKKDEAFVKASAEEWVAEPSATEPHQNQAKEATDNFSKANAEEWSKDTQSEAAASVPTAETDRWGASQPSTSDDSSRWSGELYTPGQESETGQFDAKTDKTKQPIIVDIPSSGDVPPASGTAVPKKDKIPAWAIVLIVLLVVGLCLICPFLLVLTGVVSIFQNSSIILPFLM